MLYITERKNAHKFHIIITFGEGETDLGWYNRSVNKRLEKQIWQNANICYVWEVFSILS